MTLTTLLASPIVKGALTGLAAAVMVDLRALNANSGWSTFDWKVALKHWAIGLLMGAVAGMGLPTQS